MIPENVSDVRLDYPANWGGASGTPTPSQVPAKFYGEKDFEEFYKQGVVITFLDADKNVLGKFGEISDAPAAPKVINSVPPRIEKIAEAMRSLDPKNKKHFTKAGAPRDTAVEKILGFEVSGEERAQAWEIVQGEK